CIGDTVVHLLNKHAIDVYLDTSNGFDNDIIGSTNHGIIQGDVQNAVARDVGINGNNQRCGTSSLVDHPVSQINVPGLTTVGVGLENNVLEARYVAHVGGGDGGSTFDDQGILDGVVGAVVIELQSGAT